MTKDDNPQGLELSPKPNVFGTSKRPMIIGLSLIGVILFVYFVAMSNKGIQKTEKVAEVVVTRTMPAQGMLKTQGEGIIDQLQQQTTKDLPTGVINEPKVEKQDKVIQVIMPEEKVNYYDEEELREIRRMQLEQYRNAIYAPLRTDAQVSISQPQAQYATQAQGNKRVGAPGVTVEEMTKHLQLGAGEDLPDEIRSQLNASAGNKSATDDDWQLGFERKAGMAFEMKTGTVIPAVMITGVNSDLSGSVSAQVSQNVYDSTTGKYLLLPQGSKLYGDYANGVAFGQARLFVSWKRILFPDGSSLTIADMGGSDQAGQSGFGDQVNNHYFRIFGSALLMSAITGGVSYATNKAGANNNSDEPTIQNELSVALAQQLGQVGMALVQKHLNVAPTLTIRSGYKFAIVVTKDIVFNAPYYQMTTKR